MRKVVKDAEKLAKDVAAEADKVAEKVTAEVKEAPKTAKKATGRAAKAVEKTVKKAAEKVEETTAAVKTEAKKATVKKAAPAKRAVKETIVLQYLGKEIDKDNLMKQVKEIWTKQMKNKVSEMKTVTLYLKPEENMAYYVINGEVTGGIEL